VDKAVGELDVIELHSMLVAQGWTHRIPFEKERTPAYEVGMEKVWILLKSSKGFRRLYFVALLEADKHKQPVAHSGPQEYYKAIIAGVDAATYKMRKKEQTNAFSFGACEHPGIATKKKSGLLLAIRYCQIMFAFRSLALGFAEMTPPHADPHCCVICFSVQPLN